MSAPRPKIGQVVQVHDPHGFGTITKFLPGDEAEVTFWDFDKSDTWSWMYPLKDLKALTEIQRGTK
jgi:hypothetical protein